MLTFSRNMVLIKRHEYLEMKFKIKYLEYYFMKSKKINISEDIQDRIKRFILINHYEVLTQVTYSFNKKKIKISKKNLAELKEYSYYSDELKSCI